MELSNSTKKCLLNYSSSWYDDSDGFDDVFSKTVFPDYDSGNGSCMQFGVLVIEDADDSISSTAPVMNRGDKVYLCINATGTHNTLEERLDIWGIVVPEEGAPGMVSFTTPASYTDNVMDLQ